MNIVLTTIMRKKSAVQCYGLITISNRTEHLAGIARCDDTGRNILRDNAAYNNYRAFPNRHACGDLHISAEPHIIFNVNGLCHTDTLSTLLRVDGVVDGIKAHIRSNQNMTADGYFGVVHQHTVRVDDNIIANGDIAAVLAMKIGDDIEIFSRPVQEL